ncbi:uncharacterized protein CLUP02_12850 [Colletotrichum lupini]|uniref:Uncharacterized protein n=1 Tax=Colletotrichum lupini TaxID=145971 RepID=A0A9Q8T1B4_9PEZI|nr:uncharacterized protein CLUP02_12850 [Colletotrichum lupini]UQC87346.1 hypothetical protein CLUP02_12850 [Colletotrichum lupini]
MPRSNWTSNPTHTFLRTPGRSGEFYINAASAERMVISQSYRYLGIRTSSPGQASYRSAAEGERDPILVLEVALAPLLRDVSLLATREYARSKKRPLVEFALGVILKSYSDNTTIFRTLRKADINGLTSRDWIAIHWLADLCFTPTFPGTSLEPFIFHCCVHGQTEALKALQSLKNEHSEKSNTRSMASGRDNEIIFGAVEAFLRVREKHDTYVKIRQYSCRIKRVESFARKPSHNSEGLAGCSEINKAFQEVFLWMKSNLATEFESGADAFKQERLLKFVQPEAEKDIGAAEMKRGSRLLAVKRQVRVSDMVSSMSQQPRLLNEMNCKKHIKPNNHGTYTIWLLLHSPDEAQITLPALNQVLGGFPAL